ncbi:MAG: hypothetical protein JST19_04375 [Bacteroidetes bacterium]|nr:hypothetical protein [Bacteroidota bacterium]
MKIKTISVFAILVLIAMTLFAQEKFSGQWTINTAKSDFGGAPAFTMPASINLNQKNDSLLVEFNGADRNGQAYTASARYKLDGTVVEKTTVEGGKLKASMKWTGDHKGFIKSQEYFSSSDAGKVYRSVNETWKVAPDGTLTIQQNTRIADKPESNYIIKAVYQKQ